MPVSTANITLNVMARPFPFPLRGDTPLYLAPMAGVSESPFRRICRRFGADVVVTEFLSAEAIRRENEATLAKLRFGADERPIGVQIFGADPAAMGEAARLVSDVFQPEFIDINFGCPVKKVVKRNGGSGCLKDLGLVESVIRSVAGGTSLPVTVKIRSGWSEEMRNPVEIALRCQDAGATVLTLHPRTRAQMYSGSARWDEIAAVVDALEIPVLGNGDIKTPHDAVEMKRRTGCAGVMIARGSFGQPWIFDQTRDLLDGRSMRSAPPVWERFAIALEHARMADDYELDPRGAAIEFRKHLGWYVKGLPGSADLRKKLYAVTTVGEVESIFAEYLAQPQPFRHDGRDASSSTEELADEAVASAA
ncbi:MAG: tRNA dihydrouridine synthase DusB [Acidobacteriota bacterium]|nr:tRNA dihydrouridine synthase DusB [Acidobacteriota bacterium]